MELPSGIEELVDIKFLSINATKLNMFSSRLLLRFPNLQCLRLPDHLEAPMGVIEKLTQIEEFRGRVKNVCDANLFISSRTYDTVYDINVGSVYFNFKDFTLLEGYFIYPVKEGKFDHRVRFSKYNLKNGEQAVLGHDIDAVSITYCEGLSHILLDDLGRLLGNPKCLKRLKIVECAGIDWILNGEQMMKEEAPKELQTLEVILIRSLGDLKGFIIMETRDIMASAPSRQPLFSSLRKLVVTQCHKMKKLELPLSEFPVLEQLIIGDCSKMEEIEEVGRGGGETRSASLPKLELLYLQGLPKLKSICSEAKLNCPSIKIIQLTKCAGLKKFPFDLNPPPPSLEEIRIGTEEAWALMEWEDPSHPLLLQPFLRFLDDSFWPHKHMGLLSHTA